MSNRSVMARRAVVAILAALTLALPACANEAPPRHAATPASIAPLPEQKPADPTSTGAVAELERCVARGECQLMRTREAPTHNPMQMRWWRQCQTCSNNPQRDTHNDNNRIPVEELA